MTEDLKATYETINALQLAGDYEELNQLSQYAVDAITNDDEKLRLRLPAGVFTSSSK